MTENSLLRLHLLGMLLLVLLLTGALGGYSSWQLLRDFERDSQQLEQRTYQQMEQQLDSALQTLLSYLLQLRHSAEQQLRHNIRQQTDLAWQLADQIYRANEGRLSEAQIRSLIVETLRPLRFFDGRGYFFIDDLQGNCVLLPIAPEREGQSLLDNQDDRGFPIMRGLLDATANTEGRGDVSYRWYAPDSPQMLEKITHVRRFEPLGWVIGTGDYTDYIEQQLRQQALDRLRNTRIGASGYVSVIDRSGHVLVSPGNPQSEGRHVSTLSPSEQQVVQQILQVSQQGGGLTRYQWHKPDTPQMLPKLSLVSNLDEWGWILVSGVYLDDLQREHQYRQAQLEDDRTRRLLASSAIVALAVLLAAAFSLLYSHWLGGRFARYRADLEASQIRLRQFAETDQLTGLPNHLRLHDRLEHAIARTGGHSSQLALLCIDLDHFRHINDSLGHSIGDRLLQQVALQLTCALEPGDTLSRSGGDEFVVLLEDCGDSHQVAVVAARLLEACQSSHIIDGHELSITLSIGIALYPEDGEDLSTLRRNADTALYHAKACGRNNYQFFTAAMNRRALQHLQMENLLRHALARNELQLVYQPKVCLASGLLDGGEALLRWHNPQLGEVSPAVFIPLAEECGLIESLGEWVLRETCRQLRSWLDQGLPPVRIAVNVSAKQFAHQDLPALVTSILHDSRLPAGQLELELTESVLAEDYDTLQGILARLRDMSIQLSMDDFGTGFSSLSYLNQFQLDTLKIDRAFIRDLPGNEEHRALTAAIVAMSRALGLQCVAEGIETREQMDYLRSLGCHSGQGYLFARPLPPAAFAELLRRPQQPLAGYVAS